MKCNKKMRCVLSSSLGLKILNLGKQASRCVTKSTLLISNMSYCDCAQPSVAPSRTFRFHTDRYRKKKNFPQPSTSYNTGPHFLQYHTTTTRVFTDNSPQQILYLPLCVYNLLQIIRKHSHFIKNAAHLGVIA